MRRPLPALVCAGLAGALALTACTSTPPPPAASPALKLVAFDSCDALLADVRRAAKASVQPWGFGIGGWFTPAGAAEGGMARATAADSARAPAYSGTNTHEAGVDEPDLVKTDGKRIVTVTGDRLRVIDAATHTLTGTLALTVPADQLFLSGEHVLAFGRQVVPMHEIASDMPVPARTMLALVSLTGAPRVLSTYTIGGMLADARQTGSIARIVVRSTPQITFPAGRRGDRESLIKANRKVIDGAPLAAWLPEYTGDGGSGRVDCTDISRPQSFSGASLATILSFDLTKDRLGSGVPTAVLADAETVYGSGPNLYLAHDERWRGTAARPRTEIYQFDVTGMQPAYTASGSIEGWLLNQYALSEYDGVLRAATTTGNPWRQGAASTSTTSTSTVYTLRRDGGTLRVAGSVGGLGKGEQIYAVRFTGPVGYVVTFRRTDPLYTLDLRDPAHPAVAGELKISGYSAYLHPVSGDRLLGVGQEADGDGRAQGTQISLFDVGSPAAPRRLAVHHLAYGWSEAEFDPHAFLYWPATRLLVVPAAQYRPVAGGAPGPGGAQPDGVQVGALLIRVGDEDLAELGWISHPAPATAGLYPVPIRRSLVIGDELWTISDFGAMATTLDGGRRIAWLPSTTVQ
jgi:hypothetical protein